jgi:hypothetical protein
LSASVGRHEALEFLEPVLHRYDTWFLDPVSTLDDHEPLAVGKGDVWSKPGRRWVARGVAEHSRDGTPRGPLIEAAGTGGCSRAARPLRIPNWKYVQAVSVIGGRALLPYDQASPAIGLAPVNTAFEQIFLLVPDDYPRLPGRSSRELVSARRQDSQRVGRDAVALVCNEIRQPLVMEARRIDRLLRVHPEID